MMTSIESIDSSLHTTNSGIDCQTYLDSVHNNIFHATVLNLVAETC